MGNLIFLFIPCISPCISRERQGIVARNMSYFFAIRNVTVTFYGFWTCVAHVCMVEPLSSIAVTCMFRKCTSTTWVSEQEWPISNWYLLHPRTVFVIAVIKVGCHFSQWTGDVCVTGSSLSCTMSWLGLYVQSVWKVITPWGWCGSFLHKVKFFFSWGCAIRERSHCMFGSEVHLPPRCLQLAVALSVHHHLPSSASHDVLKRVAASSLHRGGCGLSPL